MAQGRQYSLGCGTSFKCAKCSLGPKAIPTTDAGAKTGAYAVVLDYYLEHVLDVVLRERLIKAFWERSEMPETRKRQGQN